MVQSHQRLEAVVLELDKQVPLNKVAICKKVTMTKRVVQRVTMCGGKATMNWSIEVLILTNGLIKMEMILIYSVSTRLEVDNLSNKRKTYQIRRFKVEWNCCFLLLLPRHKMVLVNMILICFSNKMPLKIVITTLNHRWTILHLIDSNLTISNIKGLKQTKCIIILIKMIIRMNKMKKINTLLMFLLCKDLQGGEDNNSSSLLRNSQLIYSVLLPLSRKMLKQVKKGINLEEKMLLHLICRNQVRMIRLFRMGIMKMITKVKRILSNLR